MGVPYSKPIPSNPPDDHPAFSLESIKSTKTKGFSKKSTKSTLPTLAMPTKKESKKTVIESTEVPLVFDAQILKPTPSKELPASKKPLEVTLLCHEHRESNTHAVNVLASDCVFEWWFV
eukprot:1316452-Amorphochlora_amoeboformis.AAC.1